MNISKIITHAGQFHADEVTAVALLLLVLETDLSIVERKYEITEEEFNDPEVVILDIGRRYSTELNNYDHHQDAGLPASNVLILQQIGFDPFIREQLEKHLFTPVSDIDTGKVQAPEASFTSVIRSFNIFGDDGFRDAVNMAMSVIVSYVLNAEKAKKDKETWDTLEKPLPYTAVYHGTDVLLNWKEYAYRDNIIFLITPSQRGGYQVITRNSEENQVPVDDVQRFRHNSGFLAAYENYEACLEAMRNFIFSEIPVVIS